MSPWTPAARYIADTTDCGILQLIVDKTDRARSPVSRG